MSLPTWISPKIIENSKDLPAWLLSALAMASAIQVFAPARLTELPSDYRPPVITTFVMASF